MPAVNDKILRPPRTGLEAFEMLPEGTYCQLINDAIIMSPAPTPNHQKLSKKIFRSLDRHVNKHSLGEVFFSPIDVYLNLSNVYQPDIVFVSTSQLSIIDWNKGIMGAPDLIIEILSRDRKFDLVTKKKVYEECGVNEYWMVDPLTKWCEGFKLQNGSFASLGETTGQLTIRMFDLEITF